MKSAGGKRGIVSKISANMRERYQLYLLSIPTFIFIIVFCYVPMYGIQIAFKDFMPSKGIFGSPWAAMGGLEHFFRFFRSYQFEALIKNTLGISIYALALGFTVPILLALVLNELKSKKYKMLVQTILYAPYFMSTVVVVGILLLLLSQRSGIINQVIAALGGETIPFMAKPEMFKTIYVISELWQGAGWGTIIYTAALSNIDTELLEAAQIDGATKIQRIWHISLPCIMPTAIVILILSMGSIMSVGFEKIFLMQNPLNTVSSEVISTYVYKVGLLGAEFSFSTAVGLFNALINFSLLIIVNVIARRVNGSSLW